MFNTWDLFDLQKKDRTTQIIVQFILYNYHIGQDKQEMSHTIKIQNLVTRQTIKRQILNFMSYLISMFSFLSPLLPIYIKENVSRV